MVELTLEIYLPLSVTVIVSEAVLVPVPVKLIELSDVGLMDADGFVEAVHKPADQVVTTCVGVAAIL